MPNRLPTPTRRVRLGALTAIALLFVASLTAACASRGPGPGNNFGNLTLPAATPTATSEAAAAAATIDDSPLTTFIVPRFNVKAKVVVMGIDPQTNVMESPNNKDDVAYYDFSGRPGAGCAAQGQCSNVVLSGHVDWYTKEWGVFQHLRDLNEGDEVDLRLQDGTTFKYKVVANTLYDDGSAPVEQIIGDTPQEAVTMITCDGVFNKQLQEYNKRRVVRAVREA